jgi:DNA mismatch repair protein MutS2
MIFPEDFEKRIGFDEIRAWLKSYCLCPLGIEEVDKINFKSRKDEIEKLLQLNLEFKSILEKSERYPDQHFFDPSESFELAKMEGSHLSTHNVLLIRNSLFTIAEWSAFLIKRKEDYPALFSLSEITKVPLPLIQFIDRKISEDGKIKDSASPDLHRIRKRIASEQHRVRSVIESVLRAAQENNLVPSGTQLSFREGRVVIPVSSDHKRKIKGFIIDESATGQTVFIEPAEVMDANNEIRDLQHEEKREEIRILKEITSRIRENLSELKNCYHFLGKIDLNRAKAKLSILLEAELPKVEHGPTLNWYQAKHPLLFVLLKSKKPIVPLTIELNQRDRFLLISGPNAGGKSVCLKTVGLLQYMLQCGLLVPANSRSVFGIFGSIFLDIGDQQSIENDLSTYSSHLKNMAAFIANAEHTSMILIDEMGAGTDPNFGGGIAEAVLGELIERKTWGVVTTHYYNLKSLAANTPGIRNAAMLFDTEKLQPLFSLEIGKPGSSFAMELARKSNLPASTLKRAGQLIGEGLTGLEALMKKVMEEKNILEREKLTMDAKIKKLEADRAKYEQLAGELDSKKKEIIAKAKAEAAILLSETNREIEKTIRHIKENKAEKKETRRVREKLTELSDKVKPEKGSQVVLNEKFKAGEYVRLPGQELSGTLLSIEGNKAVVQFGLMKITVETDRLLRGSSSENTKNFRSASGVNWTQKRADFTPVLDLRGMRTEEAIPMVDHFLDEAVLLSSGEVRILHGKGEGILRKMIREHLKKNKSVASVSDEHVERGGDGISLVVLK